jgi:hypothetical protein
MKQHPEPPKPDPRSPRGWLPPTPSQPEAPKEGLGSKIAGTVFAICLCILMIAGTVRALLWMF